MKLQDERQESLPANASFELMAIQELAGRLRAGLGQLDDEAIIAVAEATGAPAEYVRLAVQSLPQERKQWVGQRLRSSFLAFDPSLRRYTMAAVCAVASGLFTAIGGSISDKSGLMGTLALIFGFGALWNAAVSRTARDGMFSGALYGGLAFLVHTLFTFVFGLLPGMPKIGPQAPWFIGAVVLGAVGGTLAQVLTHINHRFFGIKDPAAERKELVAQLLDIQERLKSDEQLVTFLSVDIVGSTRIKTEQDPLTVEYTFGEYHKFVESVAVRCGGRLHSTAGDGVTCVFENPEGAYAAGKSLLAGLFEFNTFRNKLSKAIEVRAAIHTGSVHAAGRDLTNVNFAHVIDIAAHMQKSAQPGSLAVSETTASYLAGGLDTVGSERVSVEGIAAALWSPKMQISLPKPVEDSVV